MANELDFFLFFVLFVSWFIPFRPALILQSFHSSMITLLHPIWLVLAIPLLAAWWIWRQPSGLLRGLRLAMLLAALLALCGLAIRLPSRRGTIVVLADRSLSMPESSEAVQREAIELIQRAMDRDDRLAVVSFGGTAAVERSPQTGAFAGFAAALNRDASNLAEGIEKALALIPADSPGKILVLSDGRWTGRDPATAAARAAARGINIDYRAMQRSAANDLAIAEVDAPMRVSPGEAFLITAWVKSPAQQEISYELLRGGAVLAAGKTTVSAGLNRLTFRDAAGEGGARGYSLHIAGGGQDPIPENNRAKVLVGVRGPRPLLVVSQAINSGLARLLTSGGMAVQPRLPADCDWSLDQLAQYSAVVLENVPADKITNRGMESLASWITETGAGLLMTGGKQSYGPGGYFKSPLDPLLPVSMELRQEHRKLALAIVVALDRSGSMAVEVGGGRTKMELANLASVQVLDMLSPMDEFGVIAVDSASHVIADLQPVDQARGLREQILKIDSMGGGIFVFEALSASAEMLLKAKAGTRHIILLADAADAEEPGKYEELLAKTGEAGITVSVIGLGTPGDVDANLLRDIANRGKGQIFFTENAEELPRLFAQDTIIVARSQFLEDPAPIQFTGGMVALAGKQFAGLSSIGGFNLCYLRPQASLAAVSTDEYQSPIVASWQAGAGRVLGYLGEADGEFAGQMAQWNDAGAFFTSLARWTAGETNELPDNMLVTQEIKNGIGRIRLHLDPERNEQAAPLATLPKVITLSGKPGSKPETQTVQMHWTSADSLEAEIPLTGDATALSSLEINGLPRVTLSPVTLPYSPEFTPSTNEEGSATLAQMARGTGGTEVIELSALWKKLPRHSRMVDLSFWLSLFTIVLLLLETFERSTGLLSTQLGKLPFRTRSARIAAASAATAGPDLPVAPTPAEPVSSPIPPPPSPPSLADSLAQARQNARKKDKI
jgi:Mg-chelatase subunit ChlD